MIILIKAKNKGVLKVDVLRCMGQIFTVNGKKAGRSRFILERPAWLFVHGVLLQHIVDKRIGLAATVEFTSLEHAQQFSEVMF